MWQVIESLENSSFAIWVRETPSVLAYPTVLAFHAWGMAFVVGFSVMIALRTLGFASGLPLKPMEKFFLFINLGLWVNIISGVVLLILAATTFLKDPVLYVKLGAIACALVTLRKLRASVFGGRAAVDKGTVPPEARTLASALLIFWGIAIVAGRLTAYAFSPIGWQTIVAVILALAVFLIVRRVGAGILASEKPAGHADVRPSTN